MEWSTHEVQADHWRDCWVCGTVAWKCRRSFIQSCKRSNRGLYSSKLVLFLFYFLSFLLWYGTLFLRWELNRIMVIGRLQEISRLHAFRRHYRCRSYFFWDVQWERSCLTPDGEKWWWRTVGLFVSFTAVSESWCHEQLHQREAQRG